MKKIITAVAVGFVLLSVAGVVQADPPGVPSSTVPEPATFLLVGAGLLGIGLCRKKK